MEGGARAASHQRHVPAGRSRGCGRLVWRCAEHDAPFFIHVVYDRNQYKNRPVGSGPGGAPCRRIPDRPPPANRAVRRRGRLQAGARTISIHSRFGNSRSKLLITCPDRRGASGRKMNSVLHVVGASTSLGKVAADGHSGGNCRRQRRFAAGCLTRRRGKKRLTIIPASSKRGVREDAAGRGRRPERG